MEVRVILNYIRTVLRPTEKTLHFTSSIAFQIKKKTLKWLKYVKDKTN